MLDGRIDTQGAVHELREQGVLTDIETDASVQSYKDELTKAENSAPRDAIEDHSEPKIESKKPRKLVSEEFRETGGVKWSIYNIYLKAS